MRDHLNPPSIASPYFIPPFEHITIKPQLVSLLPVFEEEIYAQIMYFSMLQSVNFIMKQSINYSAYTFDVTYLLTNKEIQEFKKIKV